MALMRVPRRPFLASVDVQSGTKLPTDQRPLSLYVSKAIWYVRVTEAACFIVNRWSASKRLLDFKSTQDRGGVLAVCCH
jgi:hypothetical protein